MASSTKPPASLLHNLFSLIAGAVTVWLLHDHQVVILAVTVGLWLLSMVFVVVRSQRNAGKFLEMEAIYYSGFSVPLFVLGLLFAACCYTIFG